MTGPEGAPPGEHDLRRLEAHHGWHRRPYRSGARRLAHVGHGGAIGAT
jgi:hypothetical protein